MQCKGKTDCSQHVLISVYCTERSHTFGKIQYTSAHLMAADWRCFFFSWQMCLNSIPMHVASMTMGDAVWGVQGRTRGECSGSKLIGWGG